MIKIIKMSDNTKDYIEAFYRIFDEMKSSMEAVTPTQSIAANHINRMIPFYEAEIAMSENILKYTTEVEIEALAKSFITEATANIETLRALKEVCNDNDSERDLFLYEKGYNDAFSRMIREMSSTPSSNNLNANFLYEMIPHHEGGMNMNKNLLKFNVCEQLRSHAEEAIMSGQVELDQMKSLLRKF